MRGALDTNILAYVRKAGRSRADARAAILGWRDTFALIETSPETMPSAADLSTDHQLGIWEAGKVTPLLHCFLRAHC